MGTVKEFVTTTRAAVKAGMAGKPMPDGKYEVLTGEKYTVVVDGVKYHRIRALRRFERPFGLPPVEVGDLGGFVAVHRGYLGHEGSCWVADEAFSAGQVTGDAQVTGRAFVGGAVVVVSECEVVDLSGEVIDEPMNTWGFPTVLVTHADGEWISSAEAFGGDGYGAVLPYYKAEYTAGTSVAHKIADIYGVELEVGDGGDLAICVSSYDKDAGYPRPVHVSPVTGIAYLEKPTMEEYEEFQDNLEKIVEQGREKRYKGHKWPQRTPEQEKKRLAQLEEACNKTDLALWARQLRRCESEGKNTEIIERIIEGIKRDMNTGESSDA